MTTATPKADRFHRAPKGGAISPVNGLFYRGGQFMPLTVTGMVSGPARLEGSVRQVQWATRLRNESLAKLDAALAAANALLMAAKRDEAPAIRSACRTLAKSRLMVKNERSAVAIIERRAMA